MNYYIIDIDGKPHYIETGGKAISEDRIRSFMNMYPKAVKNAKPLTPEFIAKNFSNISNINSSGVEGVRDMVNDSRLVDLDMDPSIPQPSKDLATEQNPQGYHHTDPRHFAYPKKVNEEGSTVPVTMDELDNLTDGRGIDGGDLSGDAIEFTPEQPRPPTKSAEEVQQDIFGPEQEPMSTDTAQPSMDQPDGGSAQINTSLNLPVKPRRAQEFSMENLRSDLMQEGKRRLNREFDNQKKQDRIQDIDDHTQRVLDERAALQKRAKAREALGIKVFDSSEGREERMKNDLNQRISRANQDSLFQQQQEANSPLNIQMRKDEEMKRKALSGEMKNPFSFVDSERDSQGFMKEYDYNRARADRGEDPRKYKGTFNPYA